MDDQENQSIYSTEANMNPSVWIISGQHLTLGLLCKYDYSLAFYKLIKGSVSKGWSLILDI